MQEQKHTAIRLPAEALRRADALGEAMGHAPELGALRVTRSAVLRVALFEGLAALEAKHLRKRGRAVRPTR